MSEALRTVKRWLGRDVAERADEPDSVWIRASDLDALFIKGRAPRQDAVIAELAAHIQTARRALADPRTERSILSAGLALDEAFQVLEGRAPQEPPAWKDEMCQLRHERDEARYHARILAHAYKSDNCPPVASVRTALMYPVNPYEVVAAAAAGRDTPHAGLAQDRAPEDAPSQGGDDKPEVGQGRAAHPASTFAGRDTPPPESEVIQERDYLRECVAKQAERISELARQRDALGAGVEYHKPANNPSGGATPQEPPRVLTPLENAARGLMNALPDPIVDESRVTWGNANVAVIKHWRESVRAQLEALEARAVPPLDKLLRRYLDNHCSDADAEGRSALCECKLCNETRVALRADPALPQDQEAT